MAKRADDDGPVGGDGAAEWSSDTPNGMHGRADGRMRAVPGESWAMWAVRKHALGLRPDEADALLWVLVDCKARALAAENGDDHAMALMDYFDSCARAYLNLFPKGKRRVKAVKNMRATLFLLGESYMDGE